MKLAVSIWSLFTINSISAFKHVSLADYGLSTKAAETKYEALPHSDSDFEARMLQVADWSIVRGDVEAFFDDRPENLIINYSVSDQLIQDPDIEFNVEFFQIDCQTPATPFFFMLSDLRTPPGTGQVVVAVDILETDGVFEDDEILVIDPNSGMGEFRFCIQFNVDALNLVVGPSTVSFLQTEFLLQVNLSQDFSTIVDAERVAAGDIVRQTDPDVVVEACQCDDNNNCIAPVIYPNSQLRVCVYSPDPNNLFPKFYVDDVSDFQLYLNGDLIRSPIAGGVTDFLTETESGSMSGPLATFVIVTQLTAAFFPTQFGSIEATGTAVLAFGIGIFRSRRLAKVSFRSFIQNDESALRLLEEGDTVNAPFNMTEIQLLPEPSEEKNMHVIVGILIASAAIVPLMYALYLFFKKKDHKNSDKAKSIASQSDSSSSTSNGAV